MMLLDQPREEPDDWSIIEAFWRDPTPFEAERVAGQAAIDALFEEHRRKLDERQAQRWREEQ